MQRQSRFCLLSLLDSLGKVKGRLVLGCFEEDWSGEFCRLGYDSWMEDWCCLRSRKLLPFDHSTCLIDLFRLDLLHVCSLNGRDLLIDFGFYGSVSLSGALESSDCASSSQQGFVGRLRSPGEGLRSGRKQYFSGHQCTGRPASLYMVLMWWYLIESFSTVRLAWFHIAASRFSLFTQTVCPSAIATCSFKRCICISYRLLAVVRKRRYASYVDELMFPPSKQQSTHVSIQSRRTHTSSSPVDVDVFALLVLFVGVLRLDAES